MMTDRLDLLLNSSAPDLNDPDLSDEFVAMVAAARAEARPVRRLPRYVATGAVVVLLLGGAGTAAAVTGGVDWAPWAEQPDDSYSFTLPSGIHCETRIGKFEGTDPELISAIKQYLGSVDIVSLADVNAAIADIRADENYLVVGSQLIPAGYGTEYYDADDEYQLAVNNAVTASLYDEMRRQGFVVEVGLTSFEGETHCES